MKIYFFLIIVVLLGISGCSDNKITNKEYVENTNPIFVQEDDLFSFLGVENETDYSNIDAIIEYKEYTTNTEYVQFTLINNNPGKGFYFFPHPFIEKLQNNEWIRLDYQPIGLNYVTTWSYCAIEGNTDKPNSTILKFFPEYLLDDFTVGEYRLVVFVGDIIIYSLFNVI